MRVVMLLDDNFLIAFSLLFFFFSFGYLGFHARFVLFVHTRVRNLIVIIVTVITKTTLIVCLPV